MYGQKTKNSVLKFEQNVKRIESRREIMNSSTHDALSNRINSANFSNTALKEDRNGESVKTLQKALNDLGYGLKVDGHYGAQTKAT